ncbi:MAG: ABC transporter permease [Deltaproteobacteria bacterium]|nr:ABC transporter permease [Deltaproteobacteria bacterium]
MVSALDRKLLRDLWRLKGQVLTIALVVACGIGAYVAMRSTWTSLTGSRDAYYQRYNFADVFVQLRRAPESVASQIAELPGVARAEARIVYDVMVPIDSLPEPATGRLVSLPDTGLPMLNGLHMRAGRLPEPGRPDEVVVVESFALEHDLEPGDRLPAVIGGALRKLHIVGIAMSPEFVIMARPAELAADNATFAALWMRRSVLAPALQMEGSFNNLTLELQPGASAEEVIAAVDHLTASYGGLGAVDRSKQTSNFYLDSELNGLEAFATVVPMIFLAVAAFLLNVVLSQLISLQRQLIAVLRALGYSARALAMHYFKLVTVIVGLGTLMGIPLGSYLGESFTALYTTFFKFPDMIYGLNWEMAIISFLVSLAAGLSGAMLALWQVLKLKPAESMRPPAPARYKLSWLDKSGILQVLGTSAMMIIRELRRRPLRLLLSSVAIAAAVGIIIVGRFGYDSFDALITGPLHEEQRGDLIVVFDQAVSGRAVRDLAHEPGVLDAEGQRVVPVRLRSGPLYRDTAIMGVADQPRLRRIVDRQAKVVELGDGLAVSAKLAEVLHLGPGDRVEVEIREGQRGTRTMVIAQLVDDAFGLQAYMKMSRLHQVLGQEQAVSLVNLRVDDNYTTALEERLKEIPGVAQVTRTDALVERFRESSGEYMLVMTLILAGFGAVIAIGVVYNNARVALAVRSRDLASLRVLGFTRREISAVLLGELAIQMLIAVPIGMVLGTYWAHGVMSTVDPETYRLPITISPQSYAFAALVSCAAGLVSALLVRRKLDRLDLIEVLKTRE